VSPHWRLALWYAAWICVAAIPVGMGVWFLYSAVYAGVFLYGVGMGAASIVSIAVTVSMLTARSSLWQGLGMAFFAARYGFVAAALGTPAYAGLWPLGPMLFGFAAVYVAENVVLLPGVSRVLGSTRAKRATDVRPKRKKLERRIVER
jgi:predicted ABC-type sugar transport system permease subunit